MQIPKIEGLSEDQVLSLTRARSYQQYLSMFKAAQKGECLFCDPLGPENVVVHRHDDWRMWKNPFPEKNTELHLVLAPVRHVSPEETPRHFDFTAIGVLYEWAAAEYREQMKGGGVLMRFGAAKLNAGTILHLHAHIIVPNLKGEVRLPLAKEPDRVAIGYERLRVYEKLRRGVPMTDLSDQERALLEA